MFVRSLCEFSKIKNNIVRWMLYTMTMHDIELKIKNLLKITLAGSVESNLSDRNLSSLKDFQASPNHSFE